MLFISFKKLFSFLKCSNFCLEFFGLGTWLDKKAKVNFKIYEVISWKTNN